MKKVIKNKFRILKKTHAYLQTILKAPVKFQKDRSKTVGGVKGTRYLLKIRNHAPHTTRHAPHTTESQKQCPSVFVQKGGGQLCKAMWFRYSYRKMAELSANSGDPDLGLHCLPITLLGVSRLKWVV